MGILTRASTGAGASSATVVPGNMGVLVATSCNGEMGFVGVAAGAAEEVEAFIVAGGAGGASVGGLVVRGGVDMMISRVGRGEGEWWGWDEEKELHTFQGCRRSRGKCEPRGLRCSCGLTLLFFSPSFRGGALDGEEAIRAAAEVKVLRCKKVLIPMTSVNRGLLSSCFFGKKGTKVEFDMI